MGCGGNSSAPPRGATGQADPDTVQRQSVPVGVAIIEQGDIAASMSLSATVESERTVKVYPQANGLVEELLAEEGDRVHAGQALVQLDDDDATITRRVAEVELRKLQSDSIRTAELYHRELVSRDDYETIVYRADRARLDLEQALLALRRTKIRAPVDGIISSRIVEIGDRVSPSAAAYELVALDQLIARVHVPGRNRVHLRVGQQARIMSDMLAGAEIDGIIERISPVIDPESGTVKVTVQLHDPTRRFTPGMFVSVALITERQPNVLLAPKEALVYDAGQPYTFVVEDGHARRVGLSLGLTNARQVQVLSGLDRGDSVIVVGQEGLRDGATVRVVTDAMRALPRDTTGSDAKRVRRS